MNARTRLRVEQHITAAAAIVLLPVALPVLATAVWLDGVGRAQEMPRPRYGCWFWRLWWWYGYHGLYQIDWALRRHYCT